MLLALFFLHFSYFWLILLLQLGDLCGSLLSPCNPVPLSFPRPSVVVLRMVGAIPDCQIAGSTSLTPKWPFPLSPSLPSDHQISSDRRNDTEGDRSRCHTSGGRSGGSVKALSVVPSVCSLTFVRKKLKNV